MAHATFKAGDLTAVIGDNEAHEEHRNGYNGLWSLRHASGPRSLFVPAYAGFNLEHVFDGQTDDRRPEAFFEPRHAPMTFRRLSDTEAELHQPPTPAFQMESWTRFTLVAPHYLDVAFRCKPHPPSARPRRDYLGLFWASYINAPEDKSLYFLGGEEGRSGGAWTQLCTQRHNDQSTVRHREDRFEPTFRAENRPSLFRSLSPLRYDLPLFYGAFDEHLWIVMFDRTEGIRFTHSPSGGGLDAARNTTNPAWDFQFLIPRFEAGREYGFRARTVFRPRCSRQQVSEEYRRWQAV